MKYWWGVTTGVVWRWRKALGVGQTDAEVSRRLIRAASEAGASQSQGWKLSAEQVEARRRRAIDLDLGRHLRVNPPGRLWTAAELRLIGTAPDAEVAATIGRSKRAVRAKRCRQSIAPARD